jgi:diguanylate cyclase (GGDEF)-like protein
VSADLDRFADAWTEAVARTSYVPMTRAGIQAHLHGLAERLATALTAEPFTAAPGYRVGADLVSAGFVAAEALGRTVTLLNGRLLDDLGLTGPEVAARLAALLEATITGAARGIRDRTLDEQEAIRRAALTAREQAEQALRASEVRLRYLALYDQLTGLPNRVLFAQRLAALLADAPPKARIGTCFIDLDGFTAVNDSLGHHVGDQLLTTVANRLSDFAADGGYLAARLGGDEFALLVTGTTCTDDMVKIADRAGTALTVPVHAGDHELPVSASIGIVERAAAGTDPAELIRAGDITLHWAKADGKARWTVFDPDRNARDVARFRLSATMPAALDRDEFTLLYQPIVDLRDGRPCGVEALARWRHPQLGMLHPDRFMDLAKDTGLIVKLGLHLLEKACRQAAHWQRVCPQPPFISVNLAVAQIRHPGLVADVTEILDRTGLPADHLQLQTNENTLAGEHDTTIGTLNALANLGIRLAIDDFGTGYANLTYLRELPVHTLKLAGSFVRCLRTPHTSDPTGETILTTLISLGHTLGLTVTAEGVETPVQAQRLAALGCELGQGWHLGRPATPRRITQLFTRR